MFQLRVGFSSHVFSLLGIIKVRWAEKKSC